MLRSLAGGALFGEAWGPAPAQVLALHGWRRTHADFRQALGDGAGPSGVLAPDLPGFGSTPPPPSPWGTAEYARTVAALFEGEAADLPGPTVVLGHSFGGRVAVVLAAARPELVRALVLTGVPLLRRPGPPRRPPIAYRLVRAMHRAGFVGEERMEAARQRHGSADYRAAKGVMREVLVRLVNERYEDALTRLSCPVELVWADDDTEAPLEVALGVEELVPQAVLTRCGPVGHLIPSTAPAALREATERALSTVSG
jgi:pimeloyl-ACP methyl ester carboxylesterase